MPRVFRIEQLENGACERVGVTGFDEPTRYAVFYDVGVPEVLWTWVAAHAPVELTAIFIASGAGMRVGLAPVFPGRQSRAAAFRERGLDSVALLGDDAIVCDQR